MILCGFKLIQYQLKILVQAKESVSQKSVPVIQKTVPVNNDTTSVCTRNSIADVTFYDYNNFILRIGNGSYKQFPFIFTEKVRQQQTEAKAHLIKHLKPGTDLPANPLHTDWMILISSCSCISFLTCQKNVRQSVTGF